MSAYYFLIFVSSVFQFRVSLVQETNAGCTSIFNVAQSYRVVMYHFVNRVEYRERKIRPERRNSGWSCTGFVFG